MNLRRWITALAVLAVFTVVAGAQVTSNQVTCTVGATTPKIRAEGVAERVGDVLVTCVNGLQLNTGNSADRITITVNYSAPITNNADATTANSDIMLVIDEPNSLSTAAATELGIQGYGPNANIIGVCTVGNQTPLTASNNLTGCPAYSFLTGNPLVYYATAATTTGTNAINVYQGAVNTAKTSVTFTNVPFVPPFLNTAQQGTQVSRVYRISNVRVNATGQASVSATVAQPVTNINDVSTFTPIASPTVSVATVVTSLSTSVVPSPLSVCVQTVLTPTVGQPQLPASASYLKFSEGFNTAFKTRVVAISSADNATSTGVDLQANTQRVDGTYGLGAYTYAASESGILIPVTGSVVSGLASSGTRLKAVFSNLATTAGTKYYVSLNNVTDFNDPVSQPTAIGDTSAKPFAVLQTQGSEIAGYVQSTDSAGSVAINSPAVPVIQLTVGTNGSAEAVWEITNTDLQADTYTFAVYAVFSANALSANPTTAATVALGYAPTNGTSSTTPVGVTTTWIPRFTAPAAGVPLLNLLPCRTTLLFPYITSTVVTTGTPPAGQSNTWQTGVAIENTGSDPLSTVGGTGICTLNFYGSGAPPSVQTPAIAPGGSYVFLATDPGNTGTAVTNWSGYAFAVCNFNYGHGFVFIEDNTRSMAMGYLAEVLNQQTASVPRGQFTLGEGNNN